VPLPVFHSAEINLIQRNGAPRKWEPKGAAFRFFSKGDHHAQQRTDPDAQCDTPRGPTPTPGIPDRIQEKPPLTPAQDPGDSKEPAGSDARSRPCCRSAIRRVRRNVIFN